MNPLPGFPLVSGARLHLFGANHPLQRSAQIYLLRAVGLVLALQVATLGGARALRSFSANEDSDRSDGSSTTQAVRTLKLTNPAIERALPGIEIPGVRPGGRPEHLANAIPDPVVDLLAEAPTIASMVEAGLSLDPDGLPGAGEGGRGWGPGRRITKSQPQSVYEAPGINTPAPVDEMPVPISLHQPEYPRLAREAGIEGRVLVRALVGIDGKVKRTIVIEGPEMLRGPARASVARALFRPALYRSRPVAVWVVVPIEFSLTSP